MKSKKPMLSVIIGIRDWDPARLNLAIRSHKECSIHSCIEVVISDYGSKNHQEIEQIARATNCVYTYTKSDVWSRSRALNAGIVASHGEFILATDADIIFSPATHSIVLDLLHKYPNSLQLKQCRDLPESIEIDHLDIIDWDGLKQIARTRPRWGMGGLAACSRNTSDRVRGYDERMIVWGAEDNDFAKRVRATGGILNWISDEKAQIYHVWHPPFLQTNPDAEKIFNINRGYLNNDDSVIRNLQPGSIYRGDTPLVSVVIATKNRATYLQQCITSVLDQTFTEFELIVIDDGSEDNTQEILNNVKDERLVCLRNNISKGVGASRNTANSIAKGRYIAVHDDDDIMFPNRLEVQLRAITAKSQGSYGGWIDFNDKTYEISCCPGKVPFNLPAITFSGGVYLHPTLMAEKRIFDSLPYYENFLAGTDYNFAIRMAWNGTKLNHCSEYIIFRRIHDTNLTNTAKTTQKISSFVTNSALLNTFSSELEKRLREEAKKISEAKIETPDNIYQLLMDTLPEDRFVKFIASNPSDIDSYDATRESVLKIQIEDTGLVLKKEYVPFFGKIPSTWSKSDVSNVYFESLQTVEANIGLSEQDFVTIHNSLAASMLVPKIEWIIIDTKSNGNIANALDNIYQYLPLYEDIFIFNSNKRWLIAYPAESPQRKELLVRKVEATGNKHRICSLKEVTQ